MISRRHLLRAVGGAALLPCFAALAKSPGAPGIGPVLGRWAVSAVPDAAATSDHATISQASASTALLTLQGEMARALGGAVELEPRPDGSFGGVARTGVAVLLSALDGRRMSLVLRGQGLYFSLFLVRP